MDRTVIENKLKEIKKYILPWREKAGNLLATVKEKFGREQSVIGIDVGLSSVKVVQIADVNGEKAVVDSALVDIGGVPGNREEALASLKTAMIGMETQGARVVAVVNCPQTCTRKIITPHMPRKELAQAVRWEARNAIPFSIDEALMDFEILEEVTEKGIKKLVVAVAAAPAATVNRLLSLFAEAGIGVSALVPVSLSLQNLIALAPEQRQSTVAVVEMGASVTELNIYREGRLAFSRKLPAAGNDITKCMTSTLMTDRGKVELSTEEAEKIKKEQGIPCGEGTELVDGKILPGQILSLVRPCVEQLSGEIERSLDFYREESHGGRVTKIILFGGGGNLKGLTVSLRNGLGIEVETGNALRDIKTLSGALDNREDVELRFDLALGAALSRTNKINLLPVELKEKTKRVIESASLKGAAVAAGMIMLLSYIGLNIQLGAQHKRIKAFNLEQRTLVPQLESARSMMMVGQVLRDQPFWEDVLREVSNVIQPGIHLTELTMKDNVVYFRGIIVEGDRDAQTVLSNFMLVLENGIFRHVNLVTTKKEIENTAISGFEIKAEVD